MSASSLLLAALITSLGVWLWIQYARAWDLGKSSPVLSYDAAQYAVAARELSDRGRLATIYALPLELARHARPPWPLALVQPGLTLAEAGLFAAAGARPLRPGAPPEDRDWLALVLPVLSYLAIGVVLAMGTARLVQRGAPGLSGWMRFVAAMAIGVAFLLDPEAQHFAIGGFTELPFTLGLVIALLALASGWSVRRPLAFGLVIGVAGLFRANMLWLAPLLALGTALASPDRRVGAFARVMIGYAIPLTPWWIYKWRAFGSPAWDLSWVSLWDGVGGRSWFTLNHLPDLPALPSGAAAAAAIGAKLLRNLPALMLELARGPRTLWLGALPIALIVTRRLAKAATGIDETRPCTTWSPARAAGLVMVLVVAISLIATAASVPISRYLFPARIPAEAAGLIALGVLILRAPESMLGSFGRRFAWIGIAVMVVTWGGFRTAAGWQAARATAEGRGVPSGAGMRDLVTRLDRELPADEPVMSNLGPVLAWHARRPVVHLATSPADLEPCRRHLDVRVVLLVFREPRRAWPQWQEVMERPGEAADHPEWNIVRAISFETADGFAGVWLDLGPLGAPVAIDRGEMPGRKTSVAAPRATRLGRIGPLLAARSPQGTTAILRTHSWPSTRMRAR
jgi:hypothetical protein